MSFYDLIVIGSGPIAAGLLSGLPNNLKIGVISHPLNDIYELDSQNTYSHIKSFGGGLNTWHGASSMELAKKLGIPSNFLHNYFCSSYYEDLDQTKDIVDKDYVYIPKKKLSNNYIYNLINNLNCSVIIDEVLKVKIIKNKILVTCRQSSHTASRVILCAGAFGSAKILNNSGLAKINKNIGNHLCGYASIDMSDSYLSVSKKKNGFIAPFKKGKIFDLNYAQFNRPSMFDMRTKKNISKYKTTYSYDKKSIYNKVIKSLSPGLVMEALYNRYGIIFGKPHINKYFQIETKNIYYLENDKIIVNKENLKTLIQKLAENENFKHADISNVISGIHFYNTINDIDPSITTTSNFFRNKRSVGSIIVADSSIIKSIGGSHHTFSLMAVNNYIAKKIYG